MEQSLLNPRSLDCTEQHLSINLPAICQTRVTLFHLHISVNHNENLTVFVLKNQHPVDYLYGVISVLHTQLRPETCKNPAVKFPVTPPSLHFFLKLPHTVSLPALR